MRTDHLPFPMPERANQDAGPELLNEAQGLLALDRDVWAETVTPSLESGKRIAVAELQLALLEGISSKDKEKYPGLSLDTRML